MIMEEPTKRREPDFRDYWGMILRRKVLIIGLCLVFAISSAVVSFLLPNVYRSDYLVNVSASPSAKHSAGEVVKIIGNVDEKKSQIFAAHSGSIGDVKIHEMKGTNQLRIVIDAGSAELIPQAFSELYDYMLNLDGIRGLQQQYRHEYQKHIEQISIAIVNSEKIERVILDLARKEKIVLIGLNPADITKKIYDMKMEKERLEGELEQFRVLTGVAGNDEKQAQRIKPDRAKIVAVSAIFGLILGILIAFFLENVHGRSEVR
jgi:capsular polysaccharide biosynthesis protein